MQSRVTAAVGGKARVWAPPRRQHQTPSAARGRLPRCSASPATEQLTAIAARLSTVRCRELLAATVSEFLKAALVGSAAAAPPPPTAAPGGAAETEVTSGSSSSSQASPEELLDSLHATVQASLQDAAHQIAPPHQEAWAEAQWEVFQEAHAAVHRLLLGLHCQAADAGSAAGALQAARCLEHGLMVPPDHAAAFQQYRRAAQLGSAEGCLRCGIHYFEGTAPAGRDGALAYDFLSQALDLAEASLKPRSGSDKQATAEAISSSDSGSSSSAKGGQGLPPLASAPADLAVEGDAPPPLVPEEVRFSALTWIGRCHLEGAGVPRSVAEAARCFRLAGNQAELQHLAELQRMFADLDLQAT